MLKPRDEILLDVVGEVLRNGLAEVRRETDARFVGLLTPLDLAPLAEKITALEAREPEVTLEKLRLMGDDLEETVERRLAMLPPPTDLTPLEAKVADVTTVVNALDARLQDIPPPPDLTPITTLLGVSAKRIDELEDRCALLPLPITEEINTLRKAVDERFEALPPPQKGDPGDKGDKGSPGEPGTPGKDGSSVTIDQVRELLDASFAKWALDVERRIMDMAQKAIDRMPQPTNGVDGIGVEDMEFVSLDERTFEMRWLRDGKVVKTHTHRFATPLDEGVWKAGTEYAKGAGVTWGGSWFIAQVENPKGRPEQSPDWRLAVKHGRDGKNGNDGKRGEKGDAGPRGQNLTALMPNGERFP